MSALPASPNHRSKIPVSPELRKKTDQILDQVSLNTLLDEKISEQTMQEFMEIGNQFSPEQLVEIFLQYPSIIAKIKFSIIMFKQHKLIDSELAGLFCAVLKEFDIAREQNSITQEKKEKLDTMLNLVKQKLTNSISNKQIEPLLVKQLILLPFLINAYIKTLKII